MSRFFQAGSDSEDSSSEEELYGSSSQSGSEQEESEEESSEGEAADDSDEDSSDDDDDSDREGRPKGANAFLKNRFLKGAGGSSDSDSDSDSDDDSKRVVRSAKDKLWDEIDGNVKSIENAKKINDFVAITAEFDKLSKNVDRAIKQFQTTPFAFIKSLTALDDFTTEASKSDNKKKLNMSNNRALNTVKQRVRKMVREHETKVNAFREDPEAFEAASSVKPSVVSSPRARDSPRAGTPVVTAGAQEEDDDAGFATVGRGGKALQYTSETVFKTLMGIIESRGKKNTDRGEQIKTLESLIKVCDSPYQLISVLLMLIPIRFDFTSSGSVMPTANWKLAEKDIRQLFKVLEDNEKTYRVSESASEPEDLEAGPAAGPDGVKEIPGSIVSLVERLDDEFTRALQIIDPHTTEYVDRLRDEADLYNLIIRAQIYVEKVAAAKKSTAASSQPLSRLVIRRLDHIYYKPTNVIVTAEKNAWSSIPEQLNSKLTPRVAQDATVPSDYTIVLINSICSVLYQQANIVFRTKAMLSHIYHYALNDRYFQARDMFLMSHLQSSIHNADPAVQVLFNRSLIQVGLCAFRSGLISEAQSSLQEICSSSKLKELLGQGARYLTQDKNRLLPFHMHINLELLECVYLTSSMLIEIPSMASLGSSTDAKKKVISKPFRRMLDYHDRQVFTGPPENTRDHIMQAAKALLNGDWATARDLLISIKIWNLMANPDAIKTMLTAKLQEEGLRTYLFSYGSYYQSLSLSTLASLFDLEARKVAAIVSKMIASEDIAAALDQKTNSVVFRQGVELSKLQVLAQSLADKAVQLAERNERLASGGSQLDQQGTSGGNRPQQGGNQSNNQQQQQQRSDGQGQQQKQGNKQRSQPRTVRA